jgi:hypothetical protein
MSELLGIITTTRDDISELMGIKNSERLADAIGVEIIYTDGKSRFFPADKWACAYLEHYVKFSECCEHLNKEVKITLTTLRIPYSATLQIVERKEERKESSSTSECFEQVIPPADVIQELKQFEKLTNIPFETIKLAFYNILNAPFMEIYSDVDERCRNAAKVLIAQAIPYEKTQEK